MVPDTGSSKKTKYKDVYLILDNDEYSFRLNINNIVSNESALSDTWENEYKYIFQSITLFDTSTSVEILNNDGFMKIKLQQGNNDILLIFNNKNIVKNFEELVHFLRS